MSTFGLLLASRVPSLWLKGSKCALLACRPFFMCVIPCTFVKGESSLECRMSGLRNVII